MIIKWDDVKVGDTFFGECFISSISVELKKNNEPYLRCVALNDRAKVSLVVWDVDITRAVQNAMESGLQMKGVATISGTCKDYANNKSYNLTVLNFDSVEAKALSLADFITGVDKKAVSTEFFRIINENLSPEYITALNAVVNVPFESLRSDLKLTGSILDVFLEGFAASGMHDAVPSGLLNHTNKVLKLMLQVIANDVALEPFKNDLILGTVLHDIGKSFEIIMGGYTPNSFVTHRTLGVELCATQRDSIISAIGLKRYYILLSVLQGHHGEWGDAPTSVVAYIVHLVDKLDYFTTRFTESLTSGTLGRNSAGDLEIREGTYRLVV